MRNHDILFDKEKLLLSFGRANCSATFESVREGNLLRIAPWIWCMLLSLLITLLLMIWRVRKPNNAIHQMDITEREEIEQF